jgi:DNA-binding PadR family transcriptional regulator
MSRVALGEFEHHVMLALQRLGGRAHGPSVVNELGAATGKSVSPASVFIALRRLEQRGLTKSRKHEPRAGEGGRGRRVFEITASGQARLRDARRTLERLWSPGKPAAETR